MIPHTVSIKQALPVPVNLKDEVRNNAKKYGASLVIAYGPATRDKKIRSHTVPTNGPMRDCEMRLPQVSSRDVIIVFIQQDIERNTGSL